VSKCINEQNNHDAHRFSFEILYGKFCHRTSNITSYWPFHTRKRWNMAGTIMALWTCVSLLQHTAMIIIIIYVILGKRSANWLFALAFIFLRWRGHIHLSRPPKPLRSCHQAREQGTGSAQCRRSGGWVTQCCHELSGQQLDTAHVNHREQDERAGKVAVHTTTLPSGEVVLVDLEAGRVGITEHIIWVQEHKDFQDYLIGLWQNACKLGPRIQWILDAEPEAAAVAHALWDCTMPAVLVLPDQGPWNR